MNLDDRARRAVAAAHAAVDAADLRRPMPGDPAARPALGRLHLFGAAAVFVAVAVVAGALAVGGDGRMTVTPDGTDERVASPPGPPSTGSDQSPFQLVSALQPFEGCEELTTYVREAALAEVGPYGLAGTIYSTGGLLEDQGQRLGLSSSFRSRSAPQDSSAPQVTGTNVQEVGVDEPDLVKTDGEILVAIAKGELQVVDVSGDAPRLLSTLDLEGGFGHEVLLSGDRALVIAGDPGYARDFVGDASPPPPATLQLVDLSDPGAPDTIATLELDGSQVVDTRLVGGAARVVVRSSPDLPFTVPTGHGLSEQLATETNRSVVQAATAEDFLPSYRLSAGGDFEEGPLVACEDVGRPDEPSGLGSLSVVTFGLADGLEPLDSVATLGAGDTVYASATSLYVAGMTATDDGSPDTAVHKFDTTDPTATSYLGSGEVRGTLLNRYSLSEHEGVLRVATTERGFGSSASMVSTLEERGGALVLLGQVGDIGRGEQIYAVRFVGDQGYVVTFRVTDPLFVLDLSDPAAPRLRGELQIPGYSAYLHPVGDGLLLGVGQGGTEEGRLLGTEVSLFDVSDPAAPARLDVLTLPGGQSEVEYDPLAFQFLADSGLVVLPLLQFESFGTEGFSGAIGIDVGASSVEERGRLSHGSANDSTSLIRRSLAVGQVLYTFSERGLATSDIDTLEQRSFLAF